MSKKIYSWQEAWDLIVNQGKKMLMINSQFEKNYYWFDCEKKEFMYFYNKQGESFTSRESHYYFSINKWIIFEEPKEFKWNLNTSDCKPDIGVEVLVKPLEGYDVSTWNGDKWENEIGFFLDSTIKKWSYIPEE